MPGHKPGATGSPIAPQNRRSLRPFSTTQRTFRAASNRSIAFQHPPLAMPLNRATRSLRVGTMTLIARASGRLCPQQEFVQRKQGWGRHAVPTHTPSRLGWGAAVTCSPDPPASRRNRAGVWGGGLAPQSSSIAFPARHLPFSPPPCQQDTNLFGAIAARHLPFSPPPCQQTACLAPTP
jgi:hypothetical protein